MTWRHYLRGHAAWTGAKARVANSANLLPAKAVLSQRRRKMYRSQQMSNEHAGRNLPNGFISQHWPPHRAHLRSKLGQATQQGAPWSEWVSERVNTEMAGWVDGTDWQRKNGSEWNKRITEWVNEWKNNEKNKEMTEWMKDWPNKWMNKNKNDNAWMENRMTEWTNKWLTEYTN